VIPPRSLPLALALVALAPASAAAQNASVAIGGSPGAITYTGTDAVDNFFISTTAGPPYYWVVARNSLSANLIEAGATCEDLSPFDKTRVRCQITGGGTLNLGGGDDFAGAAASGHGLTINGGGGADWLYPQGGSNVVNGDGGADRLSAAAPDGDAITGGEGDDLIEAPRGADDVHGGAGTDTVTFAPASPSLSASLDDVRNDGDAGAANIHADAENLTGAAERDTFTGSAAANRLDGGQGDDTLDGAGGADTVSGGEGNDTIAARDGVADAIDCGVGDDTATVDALDTVAGCETVLRPDDDLDGSPAPVDCDDHSPAIRPGAGDTPGDGIDQDCSGADAPAPPRTPVSGLPPTGRVTVTQITAPVRNRWLVDRRATKVTALSVSGAPAGARVTVTCAGKGCPFAKRSRQVPRNGKAGFTAALQGRALRPGAVLEIRITAAGAIGKLVRYTVRKGKLPKALTLCLAPGAARPAARC
jgi:hypothetical protein